MSVEEIFQTMSELVAEQFAMEPAEVTMDTSFEELGADSLDVVDLTSAVEEAFGLDELADENLSDMTTVGDFVRFLQAKLD